MRFPNWGFPCKFTKLGFLWDFHAISYKISLLHGLHGLRLALFVHFRPGLFKKKHRPESVKIQLFLLCSYTKLRDDPNLRWRDEIVSEVILHSVVSQDIDTIITFDRHGVSGHKNHCALFTALAFLCLENRIPRTCRVFTLRTVSILRKYSSIIDVPMSFLLTPSAAYVAGPMRWLSLRAAMKAHASQYVWYRRLYMLFSRYTLINTYEEMTSNITSATGRLYKRD
jgi:hypothetical protein